jgi:probable F420-dependent oxidoreductase
MGHSIKVGWQPIPQRGDMDVLRDAWCAGEELGADRIYTADHFHAQKLTAEVLADNVPTEAELDNNFEATTIQAAMAVTTTRAEIGCVVHANSYRNPNLMADIARTIDHLSGGRFILGMGAGYLQADYDAYGYEFGTARSRMLDFQRDMPIIRARFDKLMPKPIRDIPILIAAQGEIGMHIAAEHADIWHVYANYDKLARKCERMREICHEIGRDPDEIEFATFWLPDHQKDGDLDKYFGLGITHFLFSEFGPDWKLDRLKELLAWRDDHVTSAA